MLRDYFIFPPGETLADLVQNGDGIVCKDSATAIGGDLHLISDRSHVAETSYWEKIREVLLQDPAVVNIENPISSSGKIYTTQFPLRGKLRDYLPLNCGISVDLLDIADNSHTFGCNIVYDPSNTDNDLDLNPNYEESGDNYQVVFSERIPLFSYKSPADNTPFKLTLKPYDGAGMNGAEQGLTFSYCCFVSTSTPGDKEQEVDLDSKIDIYCQEKVRAETVNGSTVRITPAVSGVFSVQGKVITFTPDQDLPEDTEYTVTVKGDDPGTLADLVIRKQSARPCLNAEANSRSDCARFS